MSMSVCIRANHRHNVGRKHDFDSISMLLCIGAEDIEQRVQVLGVMETTKMIWP